MTKPSLRASFPPTARTEGVTFELTSGECLVVTGPSGVGKTTLLRKIADLDPHDGNVSLGSTRQCDIPAPQWRRKVTYVASHSGWWAGRVKDHFTINSETVDLMNKFAIACDKLNEQPAHLSTGERQRMALVRALSLRSDFLLLDEPTSALDYETALKIEAVLIRKKQEGCGLLVVTHDDGQAKRLSDGVLQIKAR